MCKPSTGEASASNSTVVATRPIAGRRMTASTARRQIGPSSPAEAATRRPNHGRDCIVIGAGPAGLNAALVLGRGRRRVLVLDNAQPRNYATHEMHGVRGHDGLDPADLRARGRKELGR